MKGNNMARTGKEHKKEMDELQGYAYRFSNSKGERDGGGGEKICKPSKCQSMKQKQDVGEQSNAPSGPALSM